MELTIQESITQEDRTLPSPERTGTEVEEGKRGRTGGEGVHSSSPFGDIGTEETRLPTDTEGREGVVSSRG